MWNEGFWNVCSCKVDSKSSTFCYGTLFAAMLINNRSKCEICSIIRNLNTKNVRPPEIYRHIIEIYEKAVMSDEDVRKWCRLFKKRVLLSKILIEEYETKLLAHSLSFLEHYTPETKRQSMITYYTPKNNERNLMAQG